MTEQPVAIDIRQLGRVDYLPTYAAMQTFTAERDLQPSSNMHDQLWICEHPPVFTQGLAGKAEHIFMAGDIPVVQTNRGGQVTFHGPGQVVAYPLIDLKRAGYFIKEYVFRIEEAVIRTLLYFGVTGHRVAGAPGIYVRLDDPAGHAATAASQIGVGSGCAAERLCPPFAHPFPRLHRPGQDCPDWHQSEPQLYLPRGIPERSDGPGALFAY